MTDEQQSTSEADVAQDDQLANSRVTGGVANADADDQASTTSTTPTEEYVGRIAGDDVGYAGETGAEARAEAAKSEVAKSKPSEETK